MEMVLTLLLNVVAFILVLGVVILVHELGHFQVGRWCGVAIDKFSIGFGKMIVSRKDKHGVVWGIGRFPIGGYVMWKGDANAASTEPEERLQDPEAIAKARADGLFHYQPLWKRAAVTLAGPMANFLFAIVMIAAFAMIFGKPVDGAVVGRVAAGSPAAVAGFAEGDQIVAAGGQKVTTFQELVAIVSAAPGQSMAFQVERDGSQQQLVATVGSFERDGKTIGRLGIESRQLESANPIEATAYGVVRTGEVIGLTMDYLAKVITGRESGNQIAGPLGIFAMTGDQAEQAVAVEGGVDTKLLSLLVSLGALAAHLSIAVGFANLLPIPILDGGHLVYYAAEAVRGRPLSQRVQTYGFYAGFFALIALFAFATWNDVSRILSG